MSRTRPKTASFLIRLWEEAPEGEGRAPVVRGYLRDLSSGEEMYLDPGQVSTQIERRFGADEQSAEDAGRAAATSDEA